MHPSRACPRTLTVVLLSVALLATACAGAPGDTSRTASGPARPAGSAPLRVVPAAAQNTPPSDPTSSPTPRRKKHRSFIARLFSLGLSSPIGPPEFTAYRGLQAGSCTSFLPRLTELQQPEQTLYLGASRACQAAFSGKKRLWPRASAALLLVSDQADQLTCLDVAVLGLLRRLVRAHHRHPRWAFRWAAPSGAPAPPCPTVAALSPDHGPAGSTVVLTGTRLDQVVRVEVVDSAGSSTDVLTDTSAAAQGVLGLTMPDAPTPDLSSTVCVDVVVAGQTDWSPAGRPFTYEGDQVGLTSTPACPPPATP